MLAGMRKILLAFLLACTVAQALAQAPPPVPALLDTERRTQYSINASTGPLAVGFPLYGDDGDPANWVTVWVNGAQTTAWTLSSATGSLSNIARPITDAKITFTLPQTGLVQIVGAQRPRRLSQFSENRGVAARDLNVAVTAAEAQLRELWDRQARTLQAPPGDVLAVIPPASTRANFVLGFDQFGNTALYAPGSGGGGAIGPCASATQGLVPATGGNPNTFLSADCTFKTITVTPPGGTISTSNYGVSGSGQTTTATCVASSTSLLLAAILDFANGQGILLNHCGAAFAVGAATVISVTPQGTTGAITYAYQISTCDGNGGVGAAAAAATTATGNLTLSPTNFNLISWTGAGGVSCYLVWRSIAGGTYAFVGSTTSTTYSDIGNNAEQLPFWVPTLPPGAALADWLVTTISSGAGGFTVTLAAAPTTSGSGVLVTHDDTAAMNTWIAAINGACGAATIPANAQIRTSAGLNAITCSNVSIKGGDQSKFLPAGVQDASTQKGVINVVGTGSGASPSSAYCMEGNAVPAVSATTGIAAAGYMMMSAPSPGGVSAYKHISSIKSASGTNLVNDVPCPVQIFDQVERFVLSGTVTNGDTLTITFTSAGITGSPVSIVVTAGGGDTLTTLAHKLAVAINANAALTAVTIIAWDDHAQTIYVGWPHNTLTLVMGSSVGGAATEIFTVTQLFTWSTLAPWTPSTNVVIDGISGDGSNIAGKNGAAYALVRAFYLANSKITNITGSNFYGGSTLYAWEGFNNLIAGISDAGSGDAQSNGIEIDGQTKLQLRDLKSIHPAGFGIGLAQCSFVTGQNISVDASQFGRGFKINSCAQGSLSGIHGNNAESIGIGLTWGTWKFQLFGWSAYGSSGQLAILNNAVGLWFSDDFSRYNRFFGGTAINNGTADIAIGTSDTNNVFYGTQYGTILNNGSATLN